jgi:hypothetical protein
MKGACIDRMVPRKQVRQVLVILSIKSIRVVILVIWQSFKVFEKKIVIYGTMTFGRGCLPCCWRER